MLTIRCEAVRKPSLEKEHEMRESLPQQFADRDFQHDVLEKLTRLEAKMEMLVGNGQPGRMTVAESRIVQLERNDVRRAVIERFVNGGIAIVISAAVALRGHWWK
jgi:hypothetical protein